uniref:Uncharacterized protein n=1 Tax=Megaselia scalaris TaxID=36166 RepID=T1H6U8_MEGSC
ESISFTVDSAVPATTNALGDGYDFITVTGLSFESNIPMGLPMKGSHKCTPESQEAMYLKDSRKASETDFLWAVY